MSRSYAPAYVDRGAFEPHFAVDQGHPLLRLLMGEGHNRPDGSRYEVLVGERYDVLEVTVVHHGRDGAERGRRTWRLDGPSVALALDFEDLAATLDTDTAAHVGR